MAKVIGVRFKNAGKLYYFDPGDLWPSAGEYVIVETIRGVELGEVITGVREIEDNRVNAPLKIVIRIADDEDIHHAAENEQKEKEALAICQEKVLEHHLDMKLVDAEYTFDNSKIQFYFTSGGRVDFRLLVKDLAAIFKTRIDLRQIGVRDEAKMLGGLGPCGRTICCGSFLGDFQPVSIKMAKEQNLSLNPTKISGVCGRLMCCLKYEQDDYECTRKRMPRPGREVQTPDGKGIVWDVNVIKETVRVRVQKGDSDEMKEYALDAIRKPGSAQTGECAKARLSVNTEHVKGDLLSGSEDEAWMDDEANPEMDAAKNGTDEAKPLEERETAGSVKESPWKRAVADALRAAEDKRH